MKTSSQSSPQSTAAHDEQHTDQTTAATLEPVSDKSEPDVTGGEDLQITQLTQKITELETALAASIEREKRVLADYQNVVRRSQEDRVRFVKMAASEFVETLLAPLDHLAMAAAQLNDKGLNMVVTELWQVLQSQGLEEIEVLNKPFDVSVMEAVDKQGKATKVVSVVSRGYRLNGEVIRHAKVVLGE